jgi:protein-S-isoprenylcysteine O-methyltransferase Ste14
MRRAVILSVHVLAILAPILLGWGLRDFPGFVANPPRALLLVAIAAGAAAVLFLQIDLNPLRGDLPHARGENWALAFLTLASVALLWFLPFADRHRIAVITTPGVRWIGLLLTCTGGLVRILALRELGPHFSAYVTLQPDHQLIQTGIYSRIRHPLYLSLLLAGPGVALIFASELVWPILIVTIAFIANRIQVEETLLAKTFQGSFLRYRDRTSTLLPFVF